jgi:hypothetical protein
MGEVIDFESMHVIVNNSHEPMSSSNYYMDYMINIVSIGFFG